MPLQATSGAASYDAFGGGVPVVPAYIEEVFQTWLYTGNDTTQTITNGIDLSTKGGMVWIKPRNQAQNHIIFDTVRGITKSLTTNNTNAQYTATGGNEGLSSFNTTGFTAKLYQNSTGINNSACNLASWTFRKQPKFFDVVTYTGTGSATTIAHNLGSVPGCIIVKKTSGADGWPVYHRSLTAGYALLLQNTGQATSEPLTFTTTAPTSTVFSIGTNGEVNSSGQTYVAYLFAHNAGGFGLTGTDNVISCGSYNENGVNNVTINLGYEPQYVMFKCADAASPWYIVDSMRGIPTPVTAGATGNYISTVLQADSSAAETSNNAISLNATGFTWYADGRLTNTAKWIYIAIRRGPMKVPTTASSVFGLSARSGTGADATVTGGQTDDAVLVKNRGSATPSLFSSRLTSTGYLVTSATDAEVAAGTTILQANPWDVMDGVKVGTTSTITNASANTYINYLFKRAPSFMDVVCYTGTGTTNNVLTHNLTIAPELVIIKTRSGIQNWSVTTRFTSTGYRFLLLNSTSDDGGSENTYGTAGEHGAKPTTTTITLGGTSLRFNASATTYVAYLFATCAGVSKVGTYTGTATTLQIDCGFTAGARFVLIKRTDSTGDWYVWDTARGIVSGNDPYLLLNSTAAEVTSTDYIDTYSAGFEISSTAPAAINASGGTFIFLAIA